MSARRSERKKRPSFPPYRALPMQALDHAAGYLLAFGIAAALCKTVTVSFPHANQKPSVITNGNE